MIFPQMATILKSGTRGNARLEYFDVSETEANFHNLRCSIKPGSGLQIIKSGSYVKLLVGGQQFMTDTDFERKTMNYAYYHAKGDILVGGLGLGMYLLAVQDKPEVKSILVLEKSADVIKLVAPQLPLRDDKTITIIQADVFTWKPTEVSPFWHKKYDFIFLDIWGDYSNDLRKENGSLKRRYSRMFKKPDGNVVSWLDGLI